MKIILMCSIQHINKYFRIFFKGHLSKNNAMLLNERLVQDYSKMFFFLPSTTDRKQKINQFFKNVSFHPIDCRYEDFRKYPTNGREFMLPDLDSLDLERRLAAREIAVKFFKDAVQVSNSNLVRNAKTLWTSGNAKINPEKEISWIGKSGKREQDKFKFKY